jgi:hypothetical protein
LEALKDNLSNGRKSLSKKEIRILCENSLHLPRDSLEANKTLIAQVAEEWKASSTRRSSRRSSSSSSAPAIPVNHDSGGR